MRACWLKWVGRDWSISADYIWLNYSDANSSAYSCRAPLLGIACIVMAVVPALSYAGNRLKASFMFPKVGAHRLTPARPYY